jgi:DNA-binding protein YbaB
MADELLDEIKNSMMGMQSQMQSTFEELAKIKLVGESNDKTVKIIMTATYAFEDIEFDEKALQGGLKEFRWRLREAWKNLSEEIQKTTQSKTMELLQGMEIPTEIKNIGLEQTAKKDEDAA